MELNIYNVIKGPWTTTKAQILNQNLNQLVFEVHMKANKPAIIRALKTIFKLDVEDIRVTIVKGKKRIHGRHVCFNSDRKKAIVTPKKGVVVNSMDVNPGTIGSKIVEAVPEEDKKDIQSSEKKE